MSPLDRRQRPALKRELETDILPRQLRALERVAERLERERPYPDELFRAELQERIEMLAVRPGSDHAVATRWAGPAVAAAGLGLVLLAVAAALAL
jgi:hypothetical protein